MVIVGIKTNEEADNTVLEVDDAVREITAALDSGKVRPSASGLVSDACGLVRDASGLMRDALNQKKPVLQYTIMSNTLKELPVRKCSKSLTRVLYWRQTQVLHQIL